MTNSETDSNQGDPATAAALAAALAAYARPDVPRHGRGSLPHGYVKGCGDECNNIECPVRGTHERCTVDCLTAAGERLLEVPAWRALILARYPLDPDRRDYLRGDNI